MIKANFKKYTLFFKNPSGTSRGILTKKDSYFIVLENENRKGIGECALLKGLSIDDVPNYEEKLSWACKNIFLEKEILFKELSPYPSIVFGLEQAFLALEKNSLKLFESHFSKESKGILINGLVWMGSTHFMKEQIREKINQGFSCIKLKISSENFEEEFNLLKSLRKNYPKLEIRVDANGAFSPTEALEKLNHLYELNLHSIEQPILAGQGKEMKKLCQKSLLSIALDEELIGIHNYKEKTKLLDEINPQYIVLKPSILGGFKASQEWINLAKERNIGWWVTSALESNIGLNALAQWTSTLSNPMPQGLGTGSLYKNNFDSPLEIKGEKLYYNYQKKWDLSFF